MEEMSCLYSAQFKTEYMRARTKWLWIVMLGIVNMRLNIVLVGIIVLLLGSFPYSYIMILMLFYNP